MALSLETDYHVGSKDVTISIVIGDAQLGASVLKIDSKEIKRGDKIQNFNVGNGPKLKGKTLSIKTVVTDVNDKTNHTSVTYKLKGGAKDNDFYLDATVDNEGDSVIYRAKFNFV